MSNMQNTGNFWYGLRNLSLSLSHLDFRLYMIDKNKRTDYF